MRNKDQFMETAGESFVYVQQYVEQQLDYLKLELAEKSSLVISAMVTTIIQMIVVFFMVGFLTLALGLYLGQVFNSYPLAFLAVGGIYLVILIILYIFRYQLITNPVLTMIIRKIYNS